MSIVLKEKEVKMLNFLKDYINQKPTKRITYEEYMDIALYHPQLGYYMKEGEKIGRNGDFITSSNTPEIMGKIIAKWYFNQVKEQSFSPAICEIGAGNGLFAKAFLEEWNTFGSSELSYIIIEKSPYHIKLQKELIDTHWPIRRLSSIDELENFNGLVYSNELFDALPVHVVKKQKGTLLEIMVTVQNGELVEELVPLTDDAISQFINTYEISLVEGQRIEIPLQMEKMASQIGEVLDKGIVVTLDYGYTNEEWLEPIRRDGSLRGYYKHKMISNPLEHPGEMDLTSHIHWDALEMMGTKYGLKRVGKWRQDQFLMHIGILNELESHQDTNPFSEVNKHNRAIRSLIMPGGISDAFHVLVQEK